MTRRACYAPDVRNGRDRAATLGLMMLAIAACSSDRRPPLDPADAAVDTSVDGEPPDASYPPRVQRVDVFLGAHHQLALDGQGTRCEQLTRALTDPAKRPPELAGIDLTEATSQCSVSTPSRQDVVRISVPRYAGLPLIATGQELVASIDASNVVVSMNGSFLPAGRAPTRPGRDAAAIRASVPGRGMMYSRFSSCQLMGTGSYAIAADDRIEIGEEGYYLDRDSRLRRVRPVDIYLLPAHVTSELINSDLFCCAGSDRCVGKQLVIDAVTGEAAGELPHCIVC